MHSLSQAPGVALKLSWLQQKPASTGLKAYAASLPATSAGSGQIDLETLITLLLTLGKENYATNQLYIPVMLSLELLMDDDIASELSKNPSALPL